MTKAFLIALKEVRTYLRDKSDLAFSLLLPVVTFALMYGAFGGQTQFHGIAYIVNEDIDGKYAAILIERLKSFNEIEVAELDAEEAEKKLAKSDLLMVLFIPEDFSERLSNQQTAQITFKQRGNGGQEGQIITGFIQAVIQEMNQEILVEKRAGVIFSEFPQEKIQNTIQKYFVRYRTNPLISLKENPVGSAPDPVNQFLTGIITMYILFAITINARSLVEERNKGTLERLMTTHLTVGQLFLGKFLAGIFRGFVQTVILLLLAYAVFRIFTPLSLLEVTLVCLIFAAVASSLALLIASLTHSEDAATWTGVFITMAMTMLSGTFFEITPGTFMETLSKISINTYAHTAAKSILMDTKTLVDVWMEIVILIGVAIILLVVSRALFKLVPGGKGK